MRPVALLVHPAGQTRRHLVDDLEAIGHGRGADLHRAAGERDELRRVAPGGDAADAGDGQPVGFLVARDLGHHVERDGLHRRAAIAAVAALAVDRGLGREGIEVDRCDGA